MWYYEEKRGGSTVQLKYHIITIEDLVPAEHFLRKLEAVLDLSFVYKETAGLYSRKYGRPPIDPVVLVKYLLVGYLYGIPSERQIEQRIQTDGVKFTLEPPVFFATFWKLAISHGGI